jgi:DNA-3-methyladenine glycosylase
MAEQRRQNRILKPVISLSFFQQDVLEIAPFLLGKYLVRSINENVLKFTITEVEAYRGEEDLACHASKGKTPRTKVMYLNGGHIYVYLVYGMYYMLNIVTGKPENPQAILIRGTKEISGPGKLTRVLQIDKSLNEKVLSQKTGLWIEESGISLPYKTTARIGVDYAKEWKHKPWRYVAL